LAVEHVAKHTTAGQAARIPFVHETHHALMAGYIVSGRKLPFSEALRDVEGDGEAVNG
jgi:hypothetical protein